MGKNLMLRSNASAAHKVIGVVACARAVGPVRAVAF